MTFSINHATTSICMTKLQQENQINFKDTHKPVKARDQGWRSRNA